jgi:RNA polymerase sigma-19 factor, ECF subfamily
MQLDPPHRRGKAADEIGRAYSRYSGELKSFLSRHICPSLSSDDLMQEIYVELLRYSPKEAVREPQAYLYKIAWHVLNRSNARVQRDAVPLEPQALEKISDSHESRRAEDATATLNAEQQILRALSKLPPLYGAALILSRRDGLSYSEIARELRISTHTVRKYLTRAGAHLRNTEWDV